MSQFDFNAPQYVDFTSGSALDLNDYADDYFGNNNYYYLKNHFFFKLFTF